MTALGGFMTDENDGLESRKDCHEYQMELFRKIDTLASEISKLYSSSRAMEARIGAYAIAGSGIASVLIRIFT